MTTLALGLLLALSAPETVRPMHVVFLKTGDANAIPKERMSQAQAGHLRYLESLWTSKRAAAIGPITDGGDTRGITILDTAKRETAREWMSGDPMVASGALATSTLQWQGDSECFAHTGKFLDIVPHRLVLLSRDRAGTQSVWLRHAQYLEKLTQERKLLASGPFLDSERLHSMLIFEGDIPATEFEAILNADPALSAGMLKAETFTWLTSKGSLARLP